MPNWCSNYLEFSGGDTEGFRKMINDGAKSCAESGLGWLPDFIEDKPFQKYLFDIEVLDDCSVQFDSKWSPPIDSIGQLLKQFVCKGIIEYEELGCGLYGMVYMDGENITELVELSDEDISEVKENDDHSCTYKGMEFDSTYDCYKYILEHKEK